MRALEDGDEVSRRDDAAFGVAPAREGFKAADFARGGADFGLVPDFNPAFFEGAVEVRDDVGAQAPLRFEAFREVGTALVVDAFDAVAGELGAVHDERDVRDVGRRVVDADFDGERHARLDLVDGLDDGLDVLFEARRARHNDEAVVVEAGHRHGAERLEERFSDAHEQLVASLEAIFLVHEAEVFDVEIEERRRAARDFAVGPLHEVHHGEQSCEVVTPFAAQDACEV